MHAMRPNNNKKKKRRRRVTFKEPIWLRDAAKSGRTCICMFVCGCQALKVIDEVGDLLSLKYSRRTGTVTFSENDAVFRDRLLQRFLSTLCLRKETRHWVFLASLWQM